MGAVTEGKTKRVTPGPKAGTVLFYSKDELTGGDAAKRVTIEGIAAQKTAQTANVFRLLQSHGIPVAFVEKVSAREILCADCEMIPLELVTRRFAWGSFLKREPSFKRSNGAPHRFSEPRCEFFHKHAIAVPPLVPEPEQMEEGLAREKYLKDGVWQQGVFTDPYVHISNGTWKLYSAKNTFDEADALLTIPPALSATERTFVIERLMLPGFLALENAWSKVITEHGPVALADLKIEAGRRKTDGAIVIADVIDNDSWRIWPGGDPVKQLDKQNFRDGHPLREVADNYALVTELTRQFAL